MSVYLLKFSSTYKSFAGAVQVTTGDGPNSWPDTWIGVENLVPVIHIEQGTVEFVAGKGDPDPAAIVNKVKSATPVALKDLSVSSSASWLIVESQKTTAGHDLKTAAKLSGLALGIHDAYVTITSTGAFPDKQIYRVRAVVATKGTPTQIKISPETATLGTASKVQLTATVFDAAGNAIIPPPALTWSSLSTDITVDQSGLVTTKTKAGSFSVKVVAGSLSATAKIVVDTGSLAPDSVLLVAPNQGGTYRIGDTLTIQWKAGSAIDGIVCQASFDAGRSWVNISEGNAVDRGDIRWSRYPWIIPLEIDNNGTLVSCVSDEVHIRVQDYNTPSNVDAADEPVTIGEGVAAVGNAFAARSRQRMVAISGSALIVHPRGQPWLVKLMTAGGKTVYQGMSDKPDVLRIGTGMFAPGIYVINITDRFGQITAPLQIVR